ncbi:MAG: hypothetical protein KFB96_21955 [Thiocapsa sp.]|nr:MAG: hypothetical protein KFB96_21955 [Thiocapsa sp.]
MSNNECPKCGSPKHPLMACPECGFTHRLAAQSAIPDTIDSSPAIAWQPPPIADQTKSSSAPVIRHKRRRLTPVAGSSVPVARSAIARPCPARRCARSIARIRSCSTNLPSVRLQSRVE